MLSTVFIVYKSLDVLIHWMFIPHLPIGIYVFCLSMVHLSVYAKSISTTRGEGGGGSGEGAKLLANPTPLLVRVVPTKFQTTIFL